MTGRRGDVEVLSAGRGSGRRWSANETRRADVGLGDGLRRSLVMLATRSGVDGRDLDWSSLKAATRSRTSFDSAVDLPDATLNE